MIKEFLEMDWHDLPVQSLKMIFEESRIELVVEKFQDGEDYYKDILYTFDEVSNLSIGNMTFIYGMEIHGCEITEAAEGYIIEYIMYYHTGKGLAGRDTTVSFNCKGFKVSESI